MANQPFRQLPRLKQLTNDAGETLDISTFTAKKVREFAAENGITLPSGNRTPVAELRQLLAQGLTAKG